MKNWMKNAYEIIKSGKDLDEDWLEDLATKAGKGYEISQGRWTTKMVTVLNFNDETYLLFWERGLTEDWGDTFNKQPVRVSTKSEIKVVKFAVNRYIDSTGKELFKKEVKLPEETTNE